MDFSETLIGAKRGDAREIDSLHRRFAPALCRRIRARLTPFLRRWYDTSDLCQSVFADVIRRLPRVEDRGERKFRHWLYIQAENKVRSKLRRALDDVARPRERLLALDDQSIPARERGPATRAGESFDCERLTRALSRLAASQRKVLELRTREDLPYAQIAIRLSLASPEAARMRHARALLALREEWTRT